MEIHNYCKDRTSGKAAYFLLGLLMVFLGACCLVYGLTLGPEGELSHRIAAPLVGLGMVALGVAEGFISIRDSMFPAKSGLAKSIREQLGRGDDAMTAEELFTPVDRDLSENGRWFGGVGIGREWMLGADCAVRLDRIRGVAWDVERYHRSPRGHHSNTQYFTVKVIDDCQRRYRFQTESESDMRAVYDFLCLQTPEAKGQEIARLEGMEEMEFWRYDQDFRRRRDQRLALRADRAREDAQVPQDMALHRADGTVTSRVTPELLAGELDSLGEQGQMKLEPLTPVAVPGCGDLRYLTCCPYPDGGLLLVALFQEEGGGLRALGLQTDRQGALDRLTEVLRDRRLEDPKAGGWFPVGVRTHAQQESRSFPRRLLVTSSQTGLTDEFSHFSRQDVELAADGLLDGKNSAVRLDLAPWLLLVERGKPPRSSQYEVSACRTDMPELRFMTTVCEGPQAHAWLLELMDGRFGPDMRSWKDATRAMAKKANKKK